METLCVCVCVCMCVCVFSHFNCAQLLATPWTLAHKAPLSMGFSRQEYWSGLPRLSPGDLPAPGTKPVSPVAPALQADSLLPLIGPSPLWGQHPAFTVSSGLTGGSGCSLLDLRYSFPSQVPSGLPASVVAAITDRKRSISQAPPSS